MENSDLEKRFTYHPPRNNQPEMYEAIRAIAKNFARDLTVMVPDSRELSVAITKLEEVVFWANAGIARNEV